MDWKTLKYCTKCKLLVDKQSFVADPQKRDGLYSSCKSCNKVTQKNRDKYKKAAYDRQYRKTLGNKKRANAFKVSEQYIDQLITVQGNLCAICNSAESVLNHSKTAVKALAVDHDHKNGQVRGLLCQRCNQAIGLLKDSPDLLMKAAAYLSRQAA